MKAVNIIWDVDKEDGIEQFYGLPDTVELPEKFKEGDCDYDEIVDYLSDKYGFCILECDIV